MCYILISSHLIIGGAVIVGFDSAASSFRFTFRKINISHVNKHKQLLPSAPRVLKEILNVNNGKVSELLLKENKQIIYETNGGKKLAQNITSADE